MRLPLIGGSYATRSIIASAQRCLNLFPELNPRDALVPVTHYQRPGVRVLASPKTRGAGRGIFRASNGQGYLVSGSGVYRILGSPSSDWKLKFLGGIAVGMTTPVSMADNGVSLVIVDSSSEGWVVDLATDAFQAIIDSSETFQGARKVDFIDTFLIFGPSPLDSNQWISTTSNQIQFDAFFVGGKTDYPDPLQTLCVNRHEILVFGQLKSEVWYDAGNPQFPFAELPGAYIEHGVLAPFSVASADISVFFLGMDLQGQGVVFRQRGYQTTRISNHALEYAIQQMAKGGADLSLATAYTYQQDGHYFYVLSFPEGDQTWVFDDAMLDPMLAWSQRGWTDPQEGGLHRERVAFAAFIEGKNLGVDWETGDLLEISTSIYSDEVSGFGACPISYARSFPHIGAGKDEMGNLIQTDGKQLEFASFIADIEAGTIEANAPLGLGDPHLTLRYSDDRGRTFLGAELQTMGRQGDYLAWPTWRQLGISRDRIFDLSWSGDGPVALNGAWIEARVLRV